MSTDIKTWQDRTGNHNVRPGSVKHMLAEITELRAALAVESAALSDAVRHVGNLKERLATQAPSAPVDVCAQMRAMCSACGGTGDVHTIDGEWRGSCDCQASIPVAPDERAAFEAWARKNLCHDLNRASDGTYYTATVDKDWHVWQAARAALSVKEGPITTDAVMKLIVRAEHSAFRKEPVYLIDRADVLKLIAAPTPPTTGEA